MKVPDQVGSGKFDLWVTSRNQTMQFKCVLEQALASQFYKHIVDYFLLNIIHRNFLSPYSELVYFRKDILITE